jgi:hypothetical protein
MRNTKTLAIVVALGLGLIFSSPFVAMAKSKKGGGGGGKESQAGGLPGLEDRVELDEGLIAALTTRVTTLETEVADLLGQNNFACVAADGTLKNHSASVTSSDTFATGEFEVEFAKDVHLCAPVATIGTNDTSPTVKVPVGTISVAADPTFAVDSDGDAADSDGILVQTTDTTGALTSLAFCLYLSCP